MVNTNYKNAITEVLCYLKGIRKEDLNKIPKDFYSYLEENSSEEYKCNIDFSKPLNELNLMNEAKGIICFIAYNYWCESKEEKDKLYEKLNENEKKFQKELSQKYDSQKIFNEIKIEKSDKTEMISVKKENIFQRIIEIFKRKFLRK